MKNSSIVKIFLCYFLLYAVAPLTVFSWRQNSETATLQISAQEAARSEAMLARGPSHLRHRVGDSSPDRVILKKKRAVLRFENLLRIITPSIVAILDWSGEPVADHRAFAAIDQPAPRYPQGFIPVCSGLSPPYA